MERAKLYVDLDDTFLNTEMYLRMVLKANDIKVEAGKTAYDYMDDVVVKELLDMIYKDYSVIPELPGAKESLDILKCDYDIVFTSSCFSEEERDAKERYFSSKGIEYVLVMGTYDLSSYIKDSEKNLIVNDKSVVLENSGICPINTYCLWNQRTSEKNIQEYLSSGGTVVFDWYELCDQIMGTQSIKLPKKLCKI